MADNKAQTTMRWIVSGLGFAVVLGVVIAMLASGHAPSLHFIGSIACGFVTFGLFVFAHLAVWKANAAITKKIAHALALVTNRDFAGAIRVWKKLLPQVGEEHVNELLPRISSAYQEIGSSYGAELVAQLRQLYTDYFDMEKRMKQLDAKGKAMRQAVANRICVTIDKLPEL
ncbi:MAG: hypothetical protein FJ276_20515 [Planctomycetes bacterium]|nr:hypothetical protein [Planctomycetota bacterium]